MKNKLNKLGRLVLALLVAFQPMAGAQELNLPEGVTAEGVTGWDATVPNTLTITVNDGAVINWQSGFNVQVGQTVNFITCTTCSVLNTDTSGMASSIWGVIYSPGQVFLVNMSGINFNAGASIDAGAMIASTLNLSKENFLAGNQTGNYEFEKVSGSELGKIINDANLTGKQIAFLAEQIQNNGLIQANLGRVALGAGAKQTLSFDSEGMISLQITQGAADAMIENNGTLRANGGKVLLTAKDVNNVLDNVVNNTGLIEANKMITHADGSVEFVHEGNVEFATDGNAVNLSTGTVKTDNLKISKGTTVKGGTSKIEVSGDWNNEGSFMGDGSEVEFKDASQVSHVLGNNEFHDLTIKTANKEMRFEAGKTQTVTGDLKIHGAYNEHVKLLSTIDDVQWKMNPLGSIDIWYAWVKDAHNLNGTDIVMRSSTNRGNSIDWDPTGYWAGGFSSNWSDGANWVDSESLSAFGGAAPGAGDDVIFTTQYYGTNTNSTVNAGFAGLVGSITLANDYTGTITLNRSLTVTTSGGRSGYLSILSGDFITNGNDVTVYGGLTVAGRSGSENQSFGLSSGSYFHGAGSTVRVFGSLSVNGGEGQAGTNGTDAYDSGTGLVGGSSGASGTAGSLAYFEASKVGVAGSVSISSGIGGAGGHGGNGIAASNGTNADGGAGGAGGGGGDVTFTATTLTTSGGMSLVATGGAGGNIGNDRLNCDSGCVTGLGGAGGAGGNSGTGTVSASNAYIAGNSSFTSYGGAGGDGVSSNTNGGAGGGANLSNSGNWVVSGRSGAGFLNGDSPVSGYGASGGTGNGSEGVSYTNAPGTISGHTYATDETTSLAGQFVSFLIDGVFQSMGMSGADGTFLMPYAAAINAGSDAVVFLDGNTEKGATVQTTENTFQGFNVYANHLTIGATNVIHPSDDDILDSVGAYADTDLTDVFSLYGGGGGLEVKSGITFYIPTGNTFTQTISEIYFNYNDSAAGVFKNRGTFNAFSGGQMRVDGGFDNNGGTFNANGNHIVFQRASGTQTLNTGGATFNNVAHSGGGTLQLVSNNLTVGGALINSAGILDANGRSVNVTGLATVSGGTYLAKAGTQAFGGLTVSGGTFTGSTGAVDINGNINLSSGTLTAPTGSFTVSGNWNKTGGTFTAGTGTVTLDGTNQTISGSNTFYNLTKVDAVNDATSRTLSLAAGTTQTITNLLTLDGLDADDRLVLSGSANINLSGSATISGDYLSVQNNTLLRNSAAISPAFYIENSILSGATGWTLTLPATTTSGNPELEALILQGIDEITSISTLINGGDSSPFTDYDFYGASFNPPSSNDNQSHNQDNGNGNESEPQNIQLNPNVPLSISPLLYQFRDGDLPEATRVITTTDGVELV